MTFSNNKGKNNIDAHKNPMTGMGQIQRKVLNRDDETDYIEDTTLYPEFIPSFDNWTSSEKQKRRAHELEDMGNQ